MSAIAMIAYRTTTVRAGEADDGDTGLRNEMLESHDRRGPPRDNLRRLLTR